MCLLSFDNHHVLTLIRPSLSSPFSPSSSSLVSQNATCCEVSTTRVYFPLITTMFLPWFDLLFRDPFRPHPHLWFLRNARSCVYSVHDTCILSLDNRHGITTHHISCPWFFSFQSFFTIILIFLVFQNWVHDMCQPSLITTMSLPWFDLLFPVLFRPHPRLWFHVVKCPRHVSNFLW